MNRIKIMINGVPGHVATSILLNALQDERFEVLPWSLTGPEITEPVYSIQNVDIRLIRPDSRNRIIDSIKQEHGTWITIDYTHPSAINDNAEFYCAKDLPFVMGTTGGDRGKLHATVEKSAIPAVIAPNMAKQIVGFQAMMEYGARTFPNLFKGYTLEIHESHQQGKADTSGTAKAMVRYFNDLGIPFSNEDIHQERNPENQKTAWGIPEKYLSGHAWHTYSLTSADQTVNFVFKHNVNGREIYSGGTFDAAEFLDRQVKKGEHGRVFTMIDVLKG
ncbi:MAG: dihydrodipicolinate reductase [Desulfobacteraceae bacterium]|nr:MAG: dihydrodipicolinate reductase [Desulfobacteraceae bacterium]